MTEWLSRFVTGLLDDTTRAAVVADGWSRAMVDAGFDRHRKTWDLDAIATTLEAEVTREGGWDAVSARLPDTLTHIWPALPGAGITPCLYAALGGISHQGIRASSRGTHFAKRVFELADGHLEPVDDLEADVVVVSGSDQTVNAVQQAARGHVVGYGHRVSFAVVDAAHLNSDIIDGLAADTVLWHQRGCFSLRAVIFIGSTQAQHAFCQSLAEKIATYETRWGLDGLAVHELADALQKRGIAEFSGTIFAVNQGWVELHDHAWNGDPIAPHVVSVHRVDQTSQVKSMVDVIPRHLQGVALAGPATLREDLWSLGVTRICGAGELQAPEAWWPHDGLPNFTCFLT